jgi:late competence protein required for DNA uptake (superfamily II DNA/RNA helicase)
MHTPDPVTSRLCSRCGKHPVTSAHLLKRQMYYCRHCWRALPCNQRAQTNTPRPRRQEQQRASDRRRIWVGGRAVARAKTDAQARLIRAHARRRLNEFKNEFKGQVKNDSTT